MSDEKKYVVPDGMLETAIEDCMDLPIHGPDGIGAAMCERALEAAVRWLAENPIEPTKEQWSKLWTDTRSGGLHGGNYKMLSEWQRRMFLAPEPEVPQGIDDLLFGTVPSSTVRIRNHDEDVREAFRRGQASAGKTAPWNKGL